MLANRLGFSQLAVNRVWKRKFQLPSNYKPNGRFVNTLPFTKLVNIWWNSLRPGRLEQLQQELLDHHFLLEKKENQGVKREAKKVTIDKDGNWINEVALEVVNGKDYKTKHVVFLHGYGASLGCFARNFHVINRFRGLKHNYKVHFLDNITFALSSNPEIKSIDYSAPIPQVTHIKMNDTKETDPKLLYKKYYKLIDGYTFDKEAFKESRDKLMPIMEDMEKFYTTALDGWRRASGIDKIDFLVGHSFGGYWSGSYALRNPSKVEQVVLLSPVGVERTAFALTAPIPEQEENQPTLDPTSYNFLSRFPILLQNSIYKWYYIQPKLPRLLKFMGPWGVAKYYSMWYSKLFAINKVIKKLGGEKVFKSENELVYGTNTECCLLVEYLYNSITTGTNSDIHVKYLLNPSTTSRWPLYDKFIEASGETLSKFKLHVVYGQYDFMNSEAGEKMVERLNKKNDTPVARYYTVAEGGHNLYIQNPFGTNELLERIVKEAEDS